MKRTFPRVALGVVAALIVAIAFATPVLSQVEFQNSFHLGSVKIYAADTDAHPAVLIDANKKQISFGDGSSAPSVTIALDGSKIDIAAAGDIAADSLTAATGLTFSGNTMPSGNGSADQVLTTDGNGVLSWADAGGGTNEIFVSPYECRHREQDQTVSAYGVPGQTIGGSSDDYNQGHITCFVSIPASWQSSTLALEMYVAWDSGANGNVVLAYTADPLASLGDLDTGAPGSPDGQITVDVDGTITNDSQITAETLTSSISIGANDIAMVFSVGREGSDSNDTDSAVVTHDFIGARLVKQ